MFQIHFFELFVWLLSSEFSYLPGRRHIPPRPAHGWPNWLKNSLPGMETKSPGPNLFSVKCTIVHSPTVHRRIHLHKINSCAYSRLRQVRNHPTSCRDLIPTDVSLPQDRSSHPLLPMATFDPKNPIDHLLPPLKCRNVQTSFPSLQCPCH